jgi:hypothetical protein
LIDQLTSIRIIDTPDPSSPIVCLGTTTTDNDNFLNNTSSSNSSPETTTTDNESISNNNSTSNSSPETTTTSNNNNIQTGNARSFGQDLDDVEWIKQFYSKNINISQLDIQVRNKTLKRIYCSCHKLNETWHFGSSN